MSSSTIYPWRRAPDWAQFGVTNEDGSAMWCESEPQRYEHVVGGYWLCDKRMEYMAREPKVNWRESIEARPEK